MKIVVISDTHIMDRNQELPEKILTELKDADMVIHAGDFVDLSLLEKLKKICPNTKAVWGNMDSPQIKEKLSQKEIIKVSKFKIGLTHGYGAPNKLIEQLQDYFKLDEVDIIIFGHSHSCKNEFIEGILFFNPGSPTDKTYASENTFGVIEISDKIGSKIIKL